MLCLSGLTTIFTATAHVIPIQSTSASRRGVLLEPAAKVGTSRSMNNRGTDYGFLGGTAG